MIDLGSAIEGKEWDSDDVHDLVDQYVEHLYRFQERHPPLYIDPGTPVLEDTIDYFPHWHFQENLKRGISASNYLDEETVFDYEIFHQYQIEPLD